MKKEKTLYIAYGSNLSKAQMAMRCPDAEPRGKALLDDYKLVFQGGLIGAHANIIPVQGESVPVVFWEISEADEKALDRYEGVAGGYYTKEYLPIDVNGKQQDALVYIMSPNGYGIPTNGYIGIIREGYQDFGFDTKILEEALDFSGEKAIQRRR